MLIRNSKTINIISIFICVIFLTFVYKYWNLSNENYLMKSKLLSNDETVKTLIDQKSYFEKLNALNDGKLEDLNSKLRDQSVDIGVYKRRYDQKKEEFDKQLSKTNELIENLAIKDNALVKISNITGNLRLLVE